MLFNTPIYSGQINRYQGINRPVQQKTEEEKSDTSKQEKKEPSYNKIYHPTPGYYNSASFAKVAKPQVSQQRLPQQNLQQNQQPKSQSNGLSMGRQQFPNGEKTAIDYTQSKINISQVIKDFKNTTEAIGSPDNVKQTVYTYVALVQEEAQKEKPNKKIIQSNLKNASQVLDEYITATLEKPSNVVEGWVDSLFLQNVEYNYDESVINPDYQVKMPQKNANKSASNEEQAEKPMSPHDTLISTLISAKKQTNPAEALGIYESVITSAKEEKDNKALSIAYFECGKLYDQFDSLDKALENYTSAIETSDDDGLKAQAYMKIAQIHHDVANLKDAGENYFSSIAYFGQTENLKAQAVLMSETGKIASEEYDKNNAALFFGVADDLADELNDKPLSAKINQKAGEAFTYLNEPQKALDYFRTSASTYSKTDNNIELAKDYQAAAKLMLDLGNPSKARTLLNKAFKASVKAESPELTKKIQAQIAVLAA